MIKKSKFQQNKKNGFKITKGKKQSDSTQIELTPFSKSPCNFRSMEYTERDREG